MSAEKTSHEDQQLIRALQDQAEELHAKDTAFRRVAWVEMLMVFVVAVLVAISLNVFFFQVIRVEGPSMEPTFFTGERVIAEKISYRFRAPARGDVVICIYKEGLNEKGTAFLQEANDQGRDVQVDGPDVAVDGELLPASYFRRERVIKRVIGLPGETVFIQDGVVHIDGQPLDESAYWNDTIWQDINPVTIPEGCIFVVGDNRNVSWDSRDPSIGSIPSERVVGRVIWTIWPLHKFGGFAG